MDHKSWEPSSVRQIGLLVVYEAIPDALFNISKVDFWDKWFFLLPYYLYHDTFILICTPTISVGF